jgi:hypothetical protein
MFDISRAAVTKRCATTWAAACIGDRVDTDHPLIQAAAANRGVALPKPARAPTKVEKAPAAAATEPTEGSKAFKSRGPKPTRLRHEEPPELPPQPEEAGSLDDLDGLALQAKPLVDRFGSSRAARDWVIFQKDLQTTIGKSLDNAQTRGQVISREFVRSHLIGLIDGMTSRLLADTPKTLCRQLYALARSGAPVEEAEKMTRQLLGKQIGSVKTQVEKSVLQGGDTSKRGRSEVVRGADRLDHERADPA